MHDEVRAYPQYATFLRSIAGVLLLASPSLDANLANLAVPLAKLIHGSSGFAQMLPNPAHLKALKPESKELKTITAKLDDYCKWFREYSSRGTQSLCVEGDKED
jgi:hypothetical protein